MDAEQPLRIGPCAKAAVTGLGGQFREAFDRVFVRIFSVDQFAVGDFEGSPVYGYLLVCKAAQMDLDAAGLGVVLSLVGEGGEIKVGAEFTVGARQQIMGEGGGD